jgi:hypothetical protein
MFSNILTGSTMVSSMSTMKTSVDSTELTGTDKPGSWLCSRQENREQKSLGIPQTALRMRKQKRCFWLPLALISTVQSILSCHGALQVKSLKVLLLIFLESNYRIRSRKDLPCGRFSTRCSPHRRIRWKLRYSRRLQHRMETSYGTPWQSWTRSSQDV